STGCFHLALEDLISSTTPSTETIVHRAPLFSLMGSILKSSSSTIFSSLLILRTQWSVERLTPVCRYSGSMTSFPLRDSRTPAYVLLKRALTGTSLRTLHSATRQWEITICKPILQQLTPALPTEHLHWISTRHHARSTEMVTESQNLIWEPMRRRWST